MPESVTQELDHRHIPEQQVRAFVVQVVEAWLGIQEQPETSGNELAPKSRFIESAVPFAEKLVRENRQLFEQLAKL